MVSIQNIDFKELTGKIFKLNDLRSHWACKWFILRSLRDVPACTLGPFSMCDPAFWALKFRSRIPRIESLHEL